MGLYEVLDGLAPGKCVEYHGVDGLIVVYEPYFHIVGRLDVAVRQRGIDSAGDVIDRDHGYLGVDRTWCENQEEVLRRLGIGPDAYTIS